MKKYMLIGASLLEVPADGQPGRFQFSTSNDELSEDTAEWRLA